MRSSGAPGRARAARLAVVQEMQVSWGKYFAIIDGVNCLGILSYNLCATMLCICFTFAHPHAWWKKSTKSGRVANRAV